jgi:signal transduction histidine kinase/PAS domain-containing protein
MTTISHSILSEERPGVLRFGGARTTLLDVEASFWGLRRQLEAMVGRRLTDAVLQQAGVNGGASFARAFIGTDVTGDAQALRDCVAAYQAAGFGQFEIEVLEWPIGRVLIRGTDTFEAWMLRQHGQRTDAPVCAYTSGVLLGLVNALSGRQDIVCVKHTCQAQGAEACLYELLPAAQAAGTSVIAFDPDPFLSHQLNLLEVLFDRMPMGIAIFDRNLVLRRCNPTWAGFIDHYTPSTAQQVLPGTRFFDLAPGTEDTLVPILERVLTGRTVRQDALCLESGGIVSHWDVVFAPLVEDGKTMGLVSVMTDATERALTQQTLEQRVEERTREIERRRQVAESLRDILAILNSNCSLDTILDCILVQAGQLLDADAVAIYRLQGAGELLRIQAAQGLDADYVADAYIPVGQSVTGRAVIERQPVMLSDVSPISPNDDLLLDQQRQALLERLGSHYRALLAVPLKNGGTYGAITLYYCKPREFTDEEIGLAVAFGDQAALAIENARLCVQVEENAVAAERSRLARDLHDSVTQILFSAGLTAEVLPVVWERDRVEGQKALEELRELTRGALAEMRTLLLELRPAALVKASLDDLLRQLAEAVIGRARIPVALEIQGHCSPPHDVKVAIYRIAQEALNNVAKHAEASQATVSLHCSPPGPDEELQVEWARLRVSDDGRGFELNRVSPDHLGIGIMRERAEAIGATLTIESRPGHGTQVVVTWQDAQGTEDDDTTGTDSSDNR